jgi:hypothetical protein
LIKKIIERGVIERGIIHSKTEEQGRKKKEEEEEGQWIHAPTGIKKDQAYSSISSSP